MPGKGVSQHQAFWMVATIHQKQQHDFVPQIFDDAVHRVLFLHSSSLLTKDRSLPEPVLALPQQRRAASPRFLVQRSGSATASSRFFFAPPPPAASPHLLYGYELAEAATHHDVVIKGAAIDVEQRSVGLQCAPSRAISSFIIIFSYGCLQYSQLIQVVLNSSKQPLAQGPAPPLPLRSQSSQTHRATIRGTFLSKPAVLTLTAVSSSEDSLSFSLLRPTLSPGTLWPELLPAAHSCFANHCVFFHLCFRLSIKRLLYISASDSSPVQFHACTYTKTDCHYTGRYSSDTHATPKTSREHEDGGATELFERRGLSPLTPRFFQG